MSPGLKEIRADLTAVQQLSELNEAKPDHRDCEIRLLET